jgi:hypothetical protein
LCERFSCNGSVCECGVDAEAEIDKFDFGDLKKPDEVVNKITQKEEDDTGSRPPGPPPAGPKPGPPPPPPVTPPPAPPGPPTANLDAI